MRAKCKKWSRAARGEPFETRLRVGWWNVPALKRGGSLLHSAYVFTPSNIQAAGLAHIRPSLHYLPVGDTTLACLHGLSI